MNENFRKYKTIVVSIVCIAIILCTIPVYADNLPENVIVASDYVSPNLYTYTPYDVIQVGLMDQTSITVYGVPAQWTMAGQYGTSTYIGNCYFINDQDYESLTTKPTYANRNGNSNVYTHCSYNGKTFYLGYDLAWGYQNSIYYNFAHFDIPRTDTNDLVPLLNLSQNLVELIDIVYAGSGGGGTNTSSTINYDLPAGNVAIIETNSSYSFVNLNTIMPLQSTSFSNNPWPNTTQRIGYYSTLPQTLNPNTMGNVIEWQRNGNTTLFNLTTSAKYNPSVVSTFKYVVIANPYYYPANDMEDSQYTNGAINISMDGVVNITVKSLTATINTQTGAVEDNYNGTEWTGQVDESTNDIIWTDGNGENNAPTSGGNLSDPSISGFQSWLKGILNNIVNIFQPAHDAINTLSGAVSNFASWMYALYVWLPSPILSLLTSAISLAIVIGIIKVFI